MSNGTEEKQIVLTTHVKADTRMLDMQGTCSAHALLEYPEIREKVAAEVRNFQGPITIKNLLALKYTTAFVKEVLRYIV